MALTAEVLFVNADYLKRMTQLNGAVDEDWFLPAVVVAQDKWIQAYLGSKLYNKLRDDIRSGTLAGDYVTLMDSYVRKATTWWTMVELIPNLYVQLANGGLVIRTQENTAAISPSDLKREVERARDNAKFYTRRMYEYLCNNTTLFPEYTTSDAGEMCPIPATYTQNGYSITGDYRIERWRQFIG